MVRWLLGLAWLGLCLGGVEACGGIASGDTQGSAGSGATEQFACPVCSNAKLSCVVNGSTDRLTRDATSSTGCAFDFASGSFSVDCDSKTFCIEGIGCSSYTASGSSISVNSSFGTVVCSPAN